jgi:hypothetical protein
MSAALPRATVAKTVLSIGDVVSNVSPDDDDTISPSMMWPMPSFFKRARSGAARSRLA